MSGPTLESGSRRSVLRPDLEFRADVGPKLESGSRSVPRPDLEFRADVGHHTRVWIPEECSETRSGVQSRCWPHTRVWIPECAETRSEVQSRCRAPHLSLDPGVCRDQIWSSEQMSGPTLESGSRRSVPRPDLEFRADVRPHTRVWNPECAETRSGVQSRCQAPH